MKAATPKQMPKNMKTFFLVSCSWGLLFVVCFLIFWGVFVLLFSNKTALFANVIA